MLNFISSALLCLYFENYAEASCSIAEGCEKKALTPQDRV